VNRGDISGTVHPAASGQIGSSYQECQVKNEIDLPFSGCGHGIPTEWYRPLVWIPIC
jgi:hypothetical protein